MRGIRARNLARDVGFVVVRVQTGGVNRNGQVLEIGPESTYDAIATEAFRRLAELQSTTGKADESRVAVLVAEHGFTYQGLPSSSGLFSSAG